MNKTRGIICLIREITSWCLGLVLGQSSLDLYAGEDRANGIFSVLGISRGFSSPSGPWMLLVPLSDSIQRPGHLCVTHTHSYPSPLADGGIIPMGIVWLISIFSAQAHPLQSMLFRIGRGHGVREKRWRTLLNAATDPLRVAWFHCENRKRVQNSVKKSCREHCLWKWYICPTSQALNWGAV